MLVRPDGNLNMPLIYSYMETLPIGHRKEVEGLLKDLADESASLRGQSASVLYAAHPSKETSTKEYLATAAVEPRSQMQLRGW